jgi:hypothetical protein
MRALLEYALATKSLQVSEGLIYVVNSQYKKWMDTVIYYNNP